MSTLFNTLLVTNLCSTGDNDIFDVMKMSLADISSVVSSDHDLGGRLIAEPKQSAGNMRQLGTDSAPRATTQIETISIESVMYKNGMNPDNASEVCETAKIII